MLRLTNKAMNIACMRQINWAYGSGLPGYNPYLNSILFLCDRIERETSLADGWDWTVQSIKWWTDNQSEGIYRQWYYGMTWNR